MQFKIYLYENGKYKEQSLLEALSMTIKELSQSNLIFKFEVEDQAIYFAENQAYDLMVNSGRNTRLITWLFEYWRKKIVEAGIEFNDSFYKSPIDYYNAETIKRVMPKTEVCKEAIDFTFNVSGVDQPLKVQFGNLRDKNE